MTIEFNCLVSKLPEVHSQSFVYREFQRFLLSLANLVPELRLRNVAIRCHERCMCTTTLFNFPSGPFWRQFSISRSVGKDRFREYVEGEVYAYRS
jgi:hypothetical protein